MSQQSYETRSDVRDAIIAFDVALREALLDEHNSLQERMSPMLKSIADLVSAYTVIIRIYDKALKRQYIVARHCPDYEDLLDNIGARRVKKVVERFIKQRKKQFYSVSNIQVDPDFQADLEDIRKKYLKESKVVYKSRYLRYAEYLEQIGPTFIVKFALHEEEENFTGMLFVGKRIGEQDWQDHETQFIVNRIPALEMFLRTVYAAEQRRGILAVQNSLDLNVLHHKQKIYPRLLKAALELIGGDLVMLRSYDKITKKLKLITSYPSDFPLAIPNIIKEGFGVTGISANLCLPCYIANTERDKYYIKTVKDARAELKLRTHQAQEYYDLVCWTKSGISVPLMITDAEGKIDINAVLAVVSDTSSHFRPLDVLAIQAFAREAAYFLQASEILGSSQKYAEVASHEIGKFAGGVEAIIYPIKNAYKQRRSESFTAGDVLDKLGEALDKIETRCHEGRELEQRLAEYALALPPDKKKGNINILIAQVLQASSHFFTNVPPFSTDPDHKLSQGMGIMTRTMMFRPDPFVPDTEFDSIQLKAVFNELFENAYLWGATSIEVATSYSREKGILEIFVEDNGRGIPAKSASEIFSPLVTLRKGEGTGLGLPLVRQAVEAHGGTVDLHLLSQERKLPRLPARFRIIVPVSDV